MVKPYPVQEIRIEDLSTAALEDILHLSPPPGIEAAAAFKQLRKIEDYVKDNEISARTAVIENHYIDRDFMEDYSVFYSRSLLPISNYCKRVHFFRGTPDEIKAEF